MTINCKICIWAGNTQRMLAKHVRDAHKLTSKAYYDQQLICEGEGYCDYCNKPTSFQTISLGYISSCKDCRSQKTKDWRKKQKSDPERHAQFTDKVKENQTRIWKERKSSGQEDIIRKKIGQTITKNNKNLTRQELSERYGWLTKLSDQEQLEWKNAVMLQTGAHKWSKTATSEMRSANSRKALATRIRTTLEIVNSMKDKIDEWQSYHRVVSDLTTLSYLSNIDNIDPERKRGSDFHLDHIYSIKAGFINQIDPKIIAHPRNLRILACKENLSKNAKCDITLAELLDSINEQI